MIRLSIGAVLQVVGRSKAAVSPLHDGRVGVRGRGPRVFGFLALPPLDLALFRQPVQSGLDARFPFLGRAHTGRFPASVVGARIVIQLLLEFHNALLRGFQVALEFLFPTEGTRPGTGRYPHAVLGDRLEFDHAHRHEAGQVGTKGLSRKSPFRLRKSATVWWLT